MNTPYRMYFQLSTITLVKPCLDALQKHFGSGKRLLDLTVTEYNAPIVLSLLVGEVETPTLYARFRDEALTWYFNPSVSLLSRKLLPDERPVWTLQLILRRNLCRKRSSRRDLVRGLNQRQAWTLRQAAPDMSVVAPGKGWPGFTAILVPTRDRHTLEWKLNLKGTLQRSHAPLSIKQN